MQSLPEFAPFVKAQAERASKFAARCPDRKPVRKQNLQRIAEQFRQLAELLETAPVTTRRAREVADRLSLMPSDISDLPKELVDELSLSEGDKQDFEILSLFEEADGILSIDHVLIRLYRRHGEVLTRQKVNSRLYRMANKGLLYAVPGKKGVYSTKPVEDPSSDSDRGLAEILS